MAKFWDFRFVVQKNTNLQNKLFGVQEAFTELCGTVDV